GRSGWCARDRGAATPPTAGRYWRGAARDRVERGGVEAAHPAGIVAGAADRDMHAAVRRQLQPAGAGTVVERVARRAAEAAAGAVVGPEIDVVDPEAVEADVLVPGDRLAVIGARRALLDAQRVVGAAIKGRRQFAGPRVLVVAVVPVRQRPARRAADLDHRGGDDLLEKEQVGAVPRQEIAAAVLALPPELRAVGRQPVVRRAERIGGGVVVVDRGLVAPAR